MSELPKCPRGCESVAVYRDGVQLSAGGERQRQRYRCVRPDGSHHRFVGEGMLSRTRGDGQLCSDCDRPLDVDGGPPTTWHSRYQVREVAAALWLLAGGASYTDTALRIRRGAWNDDGENKRAFTTVPSGQLVADWLSRFGPLAAAKYAETEWPETIVLDSTRFMDVNTRTGETNQLFCVLAAVGYPAGAKTGRLWRLRAYPLQDGPTWAKFLAELPGRPKLVVIDRDYGAIGGVQAHWGRGRNAVPIHLCEHHLYARGKAALAKDGHTAFRHELQEALAKALASPAGWDHFHRLATAAGGATGKWARHWDRRMRVQVARRSSIPAHYANGAVEAPLREVKRILAPRRWTFRNAARMNLLLELVRIRYNRQGSAAAFAGELRRTLAKTGRGQLLDAAPDDPRLRGERVSSSSLRAWIPQQPARHQPRFPRKKAVAT